MAAAKTKSWKLEDFDFRNTLGTGTFGRVRLAKLKDGSMTDPVAIKIMKKCEILRLKQVEHVKAEKNILQMIKHPFVVCLISVFKDDKRLYMVMEYVNGGELFSFLRKEGRLRNDHARYYAGQILLAFQYLHGKFIAYRDLKPENLLFDSDGNIKMTDFGFAKIVEGHTWTLCGTPEYLAPELIQSKGHNIAVDYWAFGILIFEMTAGHPPFFDDSPFGIYQKVLAGRIKWPHQTELTCRDLVKKLLTPDPARRFGVLKEGTEEVKRHKWFKGIDFSLLLSKGSKAPYIPMVKAKDDTSMFDRYPESTNADLPPISEVHNQLFEAF